MEATAAAWHSKNRMPKGATIDERIRWHVAHAKACGCRPIPASVARAIRERSGRAAAEPKPEAPRTVAAPRDLASALRRDVAAKATWDDLAYSHRKEYVRWIEEAKRPETRTRRVGEAASLLAAGKKWR